MTAKAEALKARLTDLEAHRAKMVEANKAVRAHNRAALADLGYDERAVDALFTPNHYGYVGFSPQMLSSIRGAIWATKARIAHLGVPDAVVAAMDSEADEPLPDGVAAAWDA